MYLLLATMVFVVPTFSASKGGSILQVTTALMFIVGVCMGIVQTMPVLQAANAASDNIERLEARLRAIAATVEYDGREQRKSFDRIEMRNVMFRYIRQIVRGRVPGGAGRFHLAVRRSRLHYRRQRLGQIDAS